MSKVRAPTIVFAELLETVLRGPGVTKPEDRAAAASASGGAPWIQKVRHHAYKITDEDVQALKAEGKSDDEIYELTVATAVGVAQRRLDAAMKAIEAVDAAREGKRAAR